MFSRLENDDLVARFLEATNLNAASKEQEEAEGGVCSLVIRKQISLFLTILHICTESDYKHDAQCQRFVCLLDVSMRFLTR